MRVRNQRGFTLLEVLIAVAISSIGFAAVFAMQVGSMQGNIAAREQGAAAALGERFVEVLRRDSYLWTGTTLPGRLAATAGEWHSLTPDPVDHNGLVNRTVDPANGSAFDRQRFCVHYWLQPLSKTYDGVINLRVRIIWPRAALGDPDFAAACPENVADGFVPTVASWYTYMVPATLRRHPKP